MSSPDPSTIEVSAGLVFRNGRLLITQRHADSHLGGYWEFPGGKREPGETFQQCLVRELMEELGVRVSVGELFDEVTHCYPGKTIHLKFFLCQMEKGEPEALDCAAIKWICRTELDEHSFPPADQRVLNKLRRIELWEAARD